MSCLDQMEKISALLDGELPPDEQAALERHIASCPRCRAAREAMAGLGQAIVGDRSVPLDRTFVRTTANFVRQRANRPTLPGCGARLGSFWNHPVRALVSPARKRHLRTSPRDMAKMLALFGLPAIGFALVRHYDYAPILTFALVSAVGVMIGLPLRHVGAEVSLLGSLKRGRCLEEITGSGLPAAGLVDALATQGLADLFKACLALLPVLLLNAWVIAPDLGARGYEAAAGFVPVACALFLTGSYLTQLWFAWGGGTARTLALMAAALPAAIAAVAAPFTSLSNAALGCVYLAILALAGISGRALAVWALNHPTRVERWTKQGLRERPRHSVHIPGFIGNPIARRELARNSARMLGGARGLLFWRAGMAVLPLLWGWWAYCENMQVTAQQTSFSNGFWVGALGLCVLVSVRAALRTLPAVLGEREQGCWETLLQTQVGVRTFVTGWVEVALYTVGIEGLFGASALLIYALLQPYWLLDSHSSSAGLVIAFVVLAALVASSVVGALMGLALSATSATTREASNGLLLLFFKGGAMWLAGWALSLVALLGVAGSSGFTDLALHYAPLTSMVAVGLFALTWSIRQLSCWLLAIDRPQVSTQGSRSAPLNAVLDFAALGGVGYLAATLWIWQFDRQLVSDSPGGNILPSLGLLTLGLAWFWLVRFPLATLNELCRGRLISLLLGLGFGGAAGLSVPLLLTTLDTILSHGFIKGAPHITIPEVTAGLLLTSFSINVIIGGLAGWAHARLTQPTEARARVLRLRLACSTAVSALAMFGWWTFCQGQHLEAARAEKSVVSELAAGRARASSTDYHKDNGFMALMVAVNDRGLLAMLRRPSPARVHPTVPIGAPFPAWTGQSPNQQRYGEAITEAAVENALSYPRFSWEPQAPGDHVLSAQVATCTYHTVNRLEVSVNHHWEDGEPDKALHASLLALRFIQALRGQSNVNEERSLLEYDRSVLRALISMLSNHTYTAAQDREIIAAMKLLEDRHALGAVCDRDMADWWVELARPAPLAMLSFSNAPGFLPQVLVDQRRVRAIAQWSQWKQTLSQARVPVGPLFADRYTDAMANEYYFTTITLCETLTLAETARTAAALQLYRQEHGSGMIAITELVGPYLDSVPFNYLTEQDLHCDWTEDGQPRIIGRTPSNVLFPRPAGEIFRK